MKSQVKEQVQEILLNKKNLENFMKLMSLETIIIVQKQ